MAQAMDKSEVEKRGQGKREKSLTDLYEQMFIKAVKDFVIFKGLFYYESSMNREESKKRMEKSYRFFGLVYGDEDKKRFNMIRTSVMTRIEKDLCVVCNQPRTKMILPCMFLKADCGHSIDGNCKDALLEVIFKKKIKKKLVLFLYYFFFLN